MVLSWLASVAGDSIFGLEASIVSETRESCGEIGGEGGAPEAAGTSSPAMEVARSSVGVTRPFLVGEMATNLFILRGSLGIYHSEAEAES